ncbi:MAG TPA: SRPBCC domain-containing protein [Mucilaginibacter sp.]|nr:SRPBCC domain-containing protein [Mucilaginibacter sp.]
MKDFKKYYTIPATPEEVYMALTNPLTLELWTGDETEMSTDVGSEFSLWGGSIVGKNLEFEPNKKIVQQWYFDGEPEESIVTIKLHLGKNNGTSVELRHTNIPDKEYDDFASGWDEYYFGPLAEFFEGE